MPEEGVLSLEDLHSLVKNVWLTRHDHILEEERAARRKGRPKSAKEAMFEEVTLREMEEYRTGMGKRPNSAHSDVPLKPNNISRGTRSDTSRYSPALSTLGQEGTGIHQAASLHPNIP